METTIKEETRPSKIAGVFETENLAISAKTSLVQAGFSQAAIEIAKPCEKPSKVGHKIEPETKAIWQFLKKTHYVLGTIGLIAGLVLASVMSVSGPDLVQSSPLVAHIAFGLMGCFFGLMIAGLISVRPDHDPLINETIDAAQNAKWSVIVQAEDRDELDKAREIMEPTAESVTETF